MEQYNDIAETGYNNWSDLQDLNDEYQGIQDYLDYNNPKSKKSISEKQRQQLLQQQETLRRKQNLVNMGVVPNSSRRDIGRFNPDMFNLEDESYMSSMAETDTPYGSSRYDKYAEGLYDLEHLQNVRANNQSGFNKLAAGTAKAAVLAGTTFLDGTVGLVYGLTSAVIGTAKDIANGTFQWDGSNFSKVFDNEISNGFRQINQEVERVIPNYRSELEDSRQWYQNMGTANFWADFLKQVGFTVGAFYSGAAWTKTLKAINLVKNPFGAKVTGSFMSGVNEGRIEANQIQDEHYNRELDLLNKSFQAETDSIMNRYYNGQITAEQANAALQTVYDNRDESERKIKADSDKVGLIDLAINVPILTLDNMLMYGKAYSRGFNNANKAVNKRRTFIQKARDAWKQADKEANILEDEIAKNTKKTVSGYGWDTITKGQAALKGAGHFLREGNEEMMQAYASEFASALYQPDSPDAYYQALYDPNALDNTKDFYQSAVQGFMNSYGNLDRWQEFIMGGLTGLLGTVTFGRSQNQSPDTYIGKGKRIGVTGGIFGELSAAKTYNQKGQANVDFMNKYVQRRQEDFENNVRHFAASDHFTTLMNGWAEESNRFEYENAKNNDDWEALVRFNNSGRMQDLKDMMNQDFSDLSDEDLDMIARSQDSSDQWKNPDGTYMSETPEGRAKMREKLKQNRNDLLKSIDDFERSYQSVVNITNDNLTEEQNLELAWLKWKGIKFNDRYSDIREKNRPFFQALKQSAQEYVDAFDQTVDESKLSDDIDDKTKLSDKQKYQQAKTVVDNAGKIIQLIDYLDNSSSALEFQRKAGLNYKMLNQIIDEDTYDLFASQTDMSYDQYKETVQNLLDAAKLGIAANEFDERLKQYMSDPSNIEKHHSKVRKKVDDVVDKVKAKKVANDISDMSDEILSIELDNDNIVRGDDGELRTADGTVITKGLSEEKSKEINDKFDRAEKLKKEKDEVKSSIRKEDLDIDMPITDNDKKIVNTVIDKAFENGERIIDLDVSTIDEGDLITQDEIDRLSEEEINGLIDKRKEIITSSQRKASENIESSQSQKQQTPQGSPSVNSEEKPITSGGDGVTVTPPINKEESKKEDNSKQSQEEEQSLFIDDKELDSDSDSQAQKPIQEISSSFDDVMKPVSLLPLSQQKDSISKKLGYDISKYDYIPFVDVLRKLANEGKHLYSEDVERYMFAMQDYLNQTNAFENRKKGYALRGHSVTFVTSKSVNEKAGVNIIFIRDEAGNIIGSLIPSKYGKKNAQSTQSAKNIEQFITNEYEDDIQVIKDKEGNPIQSQINNDYIGILPVSEEWNSVLDVFGDNTDEIKFGIVKETGQNNSVFTKKTDFPDSSVRTPLKSKIGQAFLLLNATSSDTPKVTVNMFIPRFNDSLRLDKNGDETYFYKHLRYVIDKIVALNNRNGVNSDQIAADIKHRLNLLFSGQNFGVEYDRNIGRITSIHIGDSAGEAETDRRNIYSLQKDGELTSDSLYKEISGRNFPINVSLGMINLNNPVDGIDVSYNEMIAEIAQVKIVPNTTHTIDDFFTIDLIDENGKRVTAESKKKSSDKSVNDQYISNSSNTGIIDKFNYDYIDSQTGIVYTAQNDIEDYLSNPKTNSGVKERIIDRAEAYVQIRMIDKDKQPIINLRFGDMPVLKYDTINKQLILPESQPGQTMQISTPNGLEIETPTPMNVSGPTVLQFRPNERQQDKPAEQPVVDDTSFSGIAWNDVNVEDANNWFNDLGGQVDDYAADWEEMSDDLKKQLFAARNIIDNESFGRIMLQIGLTGESDELSSLISGKPMFRRVDKYAAQTPNSTKEELNWLKKVYPELADNERIRIVNGLIRIQDSETSEYAWGMFKSGVIYLSNMAAQGTLYHESFHAVAHTLLTQGEFNKALDIVRRKNPNLDNIQLEEILAEEFRGYMQTEYTGYNDNLIVRIFKQLKNIIKSLFDKQYALQNLYYRISQGVYSKRNVRKSNVSRRSSTSNNMTAEMQQIKRQAIADGTFMKAPNDNPTNLDERQWLQVRTKAFKDWFGDWENDPANASKVVDENGEPLVVYHHTDNPNLTEFSTDFENYFTKDGGTKEAIFFDENETGTLGRKHDIPVFLNIRKLNEYNETKQQLHDRGTTYREVVNQSAEKNNKDGGVHMKDFDDNRMEHQSIWIVHNPNQIKSATDNNGEFSTDNNNIYYRIATNYSFNNHLLRNVWSKINEKPMSVGSEVIKWLVTGKQKFAGKEFGRTRYFINLAKQYHADYSSQSEYDTTGRTTQYNQDEVLKEVQRRIDQSNLNGLVKIITNEFGVPELVLVQEEASKLYDYFTKSWNQQGWTLENNNLIQLNREAIDFFGGQNSMTASDVLQKIYRSESGFSDLAQYMSEKLNSLNNVKVRLVGEEEFWHIEGKNHKGQGIFDPYSNTIYINEANTYNNGKFNRILMHEIVHAMAFNAKKDATQLAKLQSIFNDARRIIEKAEGKPVEQLLKDGRTAYVYYGLTNVDEFLSECLANPEFVNALNRYGGSSVRSVYNRIKNWILNIFKFNKTSDIYDRAVEFIDDMLNNQYDESDSSFDTRNMYEGYYNNVVGSQEYYEGIQEYHREKNWYENLDSDQIQYIKDNNVGYFEYLNMTDEEKNNFWMCRG